MTRQDDEGPPEEGRKRGFSVPGKATIATAAAVLACGIIGVLLGAYLHEVRPGLSAPAAYDHGVSRTTDTSTTVTTIVVTEVPRTSKHTTENSQPPPAPTTVPTTTPAPPSSSSSAPPSSSSSAPSSAPSSTPSSTTSTCGFLGCLFGGDGDQR
ncbi:hypothetical protein [Sciscionella marina]|uniref:hypothetical protein n=1 Tax=Sciscionella marina TaxID=508770 RepID=UPI0012F6EBE4|nr:hypothetical protein [Sciscionella marina]